MASSRTSKLRLDQTLQRAREPAFCLSADFRVAWVNRAWEELTGHDAAAVIGLPCQAHGPTRSGDPIGIAGSFSPPAEVRAGQPSRSTTLILHPSGERLWRSVDYWPLHDEAGRLTSILGLVSEPEAPPGPHDSEASRLRVELMEVRDRLLGRFGTDSLIGGGPAHRRLLEQISAATSSTVPVLVVGPPGAGKRSVARTIHQLGPRKHAPLIPLDCGALPPDILERELFGHSESDLVLPRLAIEEGSTLLIGDVVDLPRDLQGRLVGAFDSGVRVIATTAVDPDVALAAEKLRPDLYFLLTALVIRLRPLRERLEDLALLAQHFLERANYRGGAQRTGFQPGALRALQAYDWPGNLRELSRVVDEAHANGARDLIEAEDIPPSIRGHLGAAYHLPPPTNSSVTPLDELMTQVERRLIETALTKARQNKSRAADLLGISRPRLYRRIRELNIPDEGDAAEELARDGEPRP